MEIPVAVTPKHESGDDNVEFIDVPESSQTPHFRDKIYGIRKDGNTLLIGNSQVDLDGPGVIAVEGKRFKLARVLWHLLTRNDIDTGTFSPKDMKRYKSILQMTNVHLTGYKHEGNKNLSRVKIR
jgi:hypothetical protein